MLSLGPIVLQATSLLHSWQRPAAAPLEARFVGAPPKRQC